MLKVRLAAFTDTVTGDIKPRNIVRFGEAIKLIDLDASVRLCAGAKLGIKFSTGYVAPEMLRVDDSGAVEVVTVPVDDEGRFRQFTAAGERVLVPATSVDIWSLGVVLYQLLAGEFISTQHECPPLAALAFK